MELFIVLSITHGVAFALGAVIFWRWAKRSAIGKQAAQYVDATVTKVGKKL